MEKEIRLNIIGVIRFLVLYMLLAAMWYFFRSYMLFLLLFLVPCSGLVSCALLWMSRDNLWAEAVMPVNRVGKNTDFTFDICVHNKSRISGFAAALTYCYRNVFTGYSCQKDLRLWTAPGAGYCLHQQLSSKYAGRVEAEITKFVVYDFFRMMELTGCMTKSAAALIWPTFAENDAEEIYSCVEGFPKENESRKHGAEYNPDYEVREYIPGDELKSIHWKLSAKQENLMVKERLASGKEKINVLLPLGSNMEENDGLLEALYGLGRLLLNKEYPVQLYWPGKGMLRSLFVAEAGELENAISEILSSSTNVADARALMEMEHPGEKYILIQTGAYKGAYIC